MSRWHKVKIPVYFGVLWIRFTKNPIKAARKIGVDLQPNIHLGMAFRKNSKGAGEYVILIKQDTPDVIAHECLHVVNFILEDRGITIDTTNDEVQCYLLSWVVTQVELSKRKK